MEYVLNLKANEIAERLAADIELFLQSPFVKEGGIVHFLEYDATEAGMIRKRLMELIFSKLAKHLSEQIRNPPREEWNEKQAAALLDALGLSKKGK